MGQDEHYFRDVASALKRAHYYRPTLVIDLDRLNGNLSVVKRTLPPTLGLRIVDKSLPSIPLIGHIMEALETKRIMSFHLPVTLAVLDAFPDAEILYGKPMPAAAIHHVLSTLASEERERLLRQTVWLVDTVDRLNQYGDIAAGQNAAMRIAFEVDCGMHRGGFPDPASLKIAVERLSQFPLLACEGLLAYEAHIPEIPALFGGASAEQAKVKQRLAAFVDVLPAECRNIINTGGSKTTVTYTADSSANDVAMGSGFIMPTDFDVEALSHLQPAAFIATPVLKVLETRLPGPLAVTRLLQALGLFPRKGCFIYGGKWFADPVWPPGMKENSIWGLSSNQQLMALPSTTNVSVDDLVFFRPTQSEAVLQYFGALAIYSKGEIVDAWPVLPTG